MVWSIWYWLMKFATISRYWKWWFSKKFIILKLNQHKIIRPFGVWVESCERHRVCPIGNPAGYASYPMTMTMNKYSLTCVRYVHRGNILWVCFITMEYDRIAGQGCVPCLNGKTTPVTWCDTGNRAFRKPEDLLLWKKKIERHLKKLAKTIFPKRLLTKTEDRHPEKNVDVELLTILTLKLVTFDGFLQS